MKRNSLLNRTAFVVYHLPAILVVCALFLLLPFVYLLAFIAPVTAMSIAADAVSWGERKQGQMKADLERLRIDTKKD